MKKIQKIISFSLICFLFLVLLNSEAYADVFGELAKKTTDFAEGFRKLAIVLSGFGIVMFTFLAISGKINFKHLGYIFICLFFLSGVGAMIVYIVDGNVGLNFKDTIDDAVVSEGHSSSL